MDTIHEFIPVEVFCLHHNVEVSFLTSLHEFSLIDVVQFNNGNYIHVTQIVKAEKIVRLHTDLKINPEGIEAVLHLLDKIKDIQNQVVVLKSRLLLYE